MKIWVLVFLAMATMLAIISAKDTCAPTPSPSDNTGDVASIITSDLFEEMLKHRNEERCDKKGFYTYDGFIAAARAFNGFGTTGDYDTRKRELAAFFAQTSHITTGAYWREDHADGPYAWGYCKLLESGHHPPPYCVSPDWPCAPGKSYSGRGPIQITGNSDYGRVGKAIGVDLINNPELVETDPITSFKTAIWFWMTPQENKPSSHDVMTGKWAPSADDISAGRLPGFGLVTNIFSGHQVCGLGQGLNYPMEDGIGFYKRYCDMLGASYGDNLDCYCQKPFA
ncbi:basic endochitinase-like [Diospyros lotus]|uniref:basic endochitinase-like n=1 Tax=Diospyros lotus TaxID=55363 RepID=UPI0022548ACB|nr:basic endochitinase-like [Diospyros lotus]